MKPILVDMREMSDSKEVYESRPHPFFIWFIYMLLAMSGAAILWAACFKIDIVVTGKGTVAAEDDSSTITNMEAGIITRCNISDGQQVKMGDVLYEVEQDELELKKAGYESKQRENEKRLEMLDVYLQWLTDHTVDMEKYKENPFYLEYAARSRLASLNIDALEQEYSNELNVGDAKLKASGNMVSYYEEEIEKLNQLSNAIKTRNNPFSAEEAYYYAKVNDYITQYQNTEAQYEETLLSQQQELDDKFNQISQQQQKIAEADAVLAGAVLTDETSTDGDQNAYITAQAEKNEAETQLAAQEASAKETQQAIEKTKLQKQTALTNLETETVAAIEAMILTDRQNLLSAQGTRTEIESAIENQKSSGTKASIENVMQTEIQAVTSEISICQAEQEQLETTLAGLEKEMEETIVHAPISGTVNFTDDIVEGNYLAAGASVMTIIPQKENGYVVKAYIENQDIAKINEDMPVRYEIAAYPSSEYGTLSGKVAFVSSDLKASDENGSAYYMVETTFDNTNLYNEAGEKINLKVGMLCEAKIIVEQKSVLHCLLEKIKLMD